MAEISRQAGQPKIGSGPYLATVVNHLDPSLMGALEVQVLRPIPADPNQKASNITVRYLAPFGGNTSIKFEGNDSSNFDDVQKSYGMWMVPPDVGATVMVMFIDGDVNQGYWFGCVMDKYQNQMMPGIAASVYAAITPEQERYYGTKLLPVAEYHKGSRSLEIPKPDTFTKPVHPFADVLLSQGLLLDTIRGVTSTSARREAPSQVFGISTPGPINPKSPMKPIGFESKVMIPTSRLGGSTFVMDDGDKDGLNELIRIRTRTGHQILLHNSSDLIYIANAAGSAWIELTGQGKIDIYAEDSVSIHTEEDFNFRADRDFNLEAGRNINMFAGADFHADIRGDYVLNVTQSGKVTIGQTLDINSVDTIKMSSDGDLHLTSSNSIYQQSYASFNMIAGSDMFQQANSSFNIVAITDLDMHANGAVNVLGGTNINQESAGDFNQKVGGGWTVSFAGAGKLGGSGSLDLDAATVNLNGGSAPTAPAATPAGAPSAAQTAAQAQALPLYTLPNRDPATGWRDGNFYRTEDLVSIMKRVPTHEPYDQHENINPSSFSATATDRLNNSTTATPVLQQSGKTTEQYNVAPATKGTPPTKTGNAEQDNIAAFLWMIRNCEGTSGPEGYRTMFTSALMNITDPTVPDPRHPGQTIPNPSLNYADHPNIPNRGGGITSTAAGAYQFLYTTWKECQKQLGLPDFSPASQDKACILLLKRRKALDNIKAGNFTQAVQQCNLEWASLPGSPYNQHPKSIQIAQNLYTQGGGTVVA